MNTMRDKSPLDRLIEAADQALKAVAGGASAAREMPGPKLNAESSPKWSGEASDEDLTAQEKEYSARLMRINHAGEIAAQGLYHGQALTARSRETAERMQRNAHEESDHLAWCEQRLDRLGGHTSVLAPLWYAGSFVIGAAAGLAGDRWSLGFVKETEDQVVRHLDSHLAKAPVRDKATLAVIEQIKRDETEHAHAAELAGAAELPEAVKRLMGVTAKVMTTTAYYF